jgi:hypothetical protein
MRKHMTAVVALSVCLALALGACGSGDSDDEPEGTSTSTTTTTQAAQEDPLVGEWVATNDCDEFVAALEEAGLEQFAAEMAPGATGTPGKADPSDPCQGAQPAEHSHSFSESGDFNSYDAQGKEVDFGTYEITDEGTFTLTRSPFESDVRYQVQGDTATFEPVVPDCKDKQCQTEAALAIATFFPGTYERVK